MNRSTRERLGRLLARLIPAVVVMGLGWQLLAGSHSVFRHLELRETAARSIAEWGALGRQNMATNLWLAHLEDDPINLERLAADVHGYARPGSVVYRFQDGAAPAGEGDVPPFAVGSAVGQAAGAAGGEAAEALPSARR